MPHSAFISGDAAVTTFEHGFVQFAPFELEADTEIMIITEWNFTEPARTARDWSVTVWAETGELSLRHEKGWTSDHMPVIDRVKPMRSLRPADHDSDDDHKKGKFSDWL